MRGAGKLSSKKKSSRDGMDACKRRKGGILRRKVPVCEYFIEASKQGETKVNKRRKGPFNRRHYSDK